MGNVTLDMAISLDGFIAGPNDEDSGLHDYFFSPASSTTLVIKEGFKTTGAIMMGQPTCLAVCIRRIPSKKSKVRKLT